jgi:hypothetical protein
MRNVGLKGSAGSGIILSPNKAREDLKPWSKMAGGMFKDAMGETKATSKQTNLIKVRCRGCKTLNDEDSIFCKSCGQKV